MGMIKKANNVTRHIKSGNLGLAIKSFFTPESSSGGAPYFAPEFGGPNYIGGGYSGVLPFHEMDTIFGSKHFTVSGQGDYSRAYFACPSLSAIINRKAQSYTNGKTNIIYRTGEDKGMDADTEVSRLVSKLMAKPNPLQTWKQFEAQQYIYIQIYGYCPVLINKPSGFPNYKADSIWNIPPYMLSVEEKDGLFYKAKDNSAKEIVINYKDEQVSLNVNNVYFFRDIMPSFHTTFLPDSRIKTLEMPINNIIGAYESRNMLINSRGALGILSNRTKDAYSSIPLSKPEKKELYDEFKRVHGLRKGQIGIIIAGADLHWQSMVMPTRELMLFEEIEDSNNRICDAYMFPPELLGRMDKNTLPANMQTATRNLYLDAIIPEAESNYQQWNDMFETYKHNIKIVRNYEHLSVLQPDKKAEAEALLRMNQALQIQFRNNQITVNEWRVRVGLSPIGDGDRYYSDLKEDLRINYNRGMENTDVDDTYVEDNLNPREEGGALNVNYDE